MTNGTKPRTPSRPIVFLSRAMLWSFMFLQSVDRAIYGLKEAFNSLNSVVFTSQKK